MVSRPCKHVHYRFQLTAARRRLALTDAAKQARLEKRREALERLYEKRPD